MRGDEETRDDDVIDPEDAEVELEEDEAEADFNPNATVISEETDESEDEGPKEHEEIIPEGDEQDDSEQEDVNLLNANEPKVSELVETDVAKYRVTGLVDYTDEQGNIVGQLPVDSIQEVPVLLGDSWVEAGQAEKVQ